MKAATDKSFRLLAARYLGKQARKLSKQLDGACRADNIEFVHQARVATRRLRAGLQLFRDCFPRKRWKRWQKQIRQITSGLGAARDKDVQIEYLCGLLADVEEEIRVPGIARLLVQVEQQREHLQPQVVEAVAHFLSSGVLEEIRKVTGRIVKQSNGKRVAPPSPAAAKRIRKTILDHLAALRSYHDCLDEPDDSEQHHAMRIAAKRLRYTVEISNSVYDGALDEHLEVIKRVQTFLGDIHDCDVWAEDLREFARAEKRQIAIRFGDDGPYERLRPGIERLAQHRLDQRVAVFDKLVEFWRELEAIRQWDRLIETVKSGGKHPAEATAAPAEQTAAEADRCETAGRSRRPAESATARNGNGASSPMPQPEPVGS